MAAVLIIVAANLGSSLLPFGNPQNLFLFSYYKLTFQQFLLWMLPFLILAVILLSLLLMRIPTDKLALDYQSPKNISWNRTLLPFLAMILMISSILKLLPLDLVLLLVIFLIALTDRRSFKMVDYWLLLTFVFFFLIIGNLAQSTFFVEMIQKIFTSEHSVLLGSAAISQLISNVPAAILLAPFTDHSQALLSGVNIGGLGTLIASLANLIGFKIYTLHFSYQKAQFIKLFSIVNFLLLFVFLLVFFFLVGQ